MIINEKTEYNDFFSEVEHKHHDQIAGIDYACVHNTMWRKALIYKLSRSKTPKTQETERFKHPGITSGILC